jgi:hypothetical protein
MSATVFDAGTHFIVSGSDEASVAAKVAELAAGGMKVIAVPGIKSVVTRPTLEAVAEKVSQLQLGGAIIEQPPELIDGVWTAVCDGPL